MKKRIVTSLVQVAAFVAIITVILGAIQGVLSILRPNAEPGTIGTSADNDPRGMPLRTNTVANVVAAVNSTIVLIETTETANDTRPQAPGQGDTKTHLQPGPAPRAVLPIAPSSGPESIESRVTDLETRLAQLQTALIGARDSGPKTPSRGVGTGFILRSDGYIVTNAHVIEGDGGTFAASIKVTTADGKTYAAVVVGADNKTDLAVIKIESTGLPAAKLGASSTMQLGDPVIAIGHPFGLIDTVTTGNISGVGREWASLKNMMQITGSVNPGNSGGPLFDLKGQVIGINTAKIGDQEHFFDIGFATPIDDGRPIVDKLMQFGSTERPWLGITIEEADAIAPDQGKTIVIADVTPFGPADKFGLSANDAIKQVNGKDVTSATAVQDIVAATPAGENIAFYVLRDGLPVEIEVTVGVHSYVNSAAVQTTK